jgi:hypothetical protein
MPEYRAYIVGSDGHFRDAISMNCDSDETASQRANNLARAESVEIELWQGARMVASFKHPGAKSGETVTHEVQDGRMISKPAT